MADLSVAVRFDPKPTRHLAPWGAHWREARKPGHTKRKARSKYFATEAEARAWAVDLVEAAKRLGAPAPAAAPGERPNGKWTVADYMDYFLARVQDSPRTVATYESYEINTRLYIKTGTLDNGQRFADLRLNELGPLVVKEFLRRLPVALRKRKLIKAILSSACGMAVGDELIPRNPCAGVGLRDIRKQSEAELKPDPNPLTRDEARRVLAWVSKHEPEWLPHFTFLLYTGVRLGELIALKWDHIHWDTNTATIEASFCPRAGKDKDTKTHRQRDVDLAPPVLTQLKAQRKRQRVETFRRGRPAPAYAFAQTHGRNGTRLGACSIARAMDRALKGAKVTARRTIHSWRDSFASWHLSAEWARLPWVSDQLGHESERTTIEHYFKFQPSNDSKTFAARLPLR